MEKEYKNKSCYMCKFLDRYYVKGDKRFNKTHFGWCCKKACATNVHETCDNFTLKVIEKGVSNTVKCCLNFFLTELTAMREVLEEERNETEKV